MKISRRARQWSGASRRSNSPVPAWRTDAWRHQFGATSAGLAADCGRSSTVPPRPATPAPIARWPAASWSTAPAIAPRTQKIEHHPYRGRSGPSVKPRHALPQGLGAALTSSTRLRPGLEQPKYRAPGSNEFQPVSWNFALDRIARLMKRDRDRDTSSPRTPPAATVNRWLTTTGMPGGFRFLDPRPPT